MFLFAPNAGTLKARSQRVAQRLLMARNAGTGSATALRAGRSESKGVRGAIPVPVVEPRIEAGVVSRGYHECQ